MFVVFTYVFATISSVLAATYTVFMIDLYVFAAFTYVVAIISIVSAVIYTVTVAIYIA